MTKDTYVEVHTNTRSWGVIGDGHVAWETDEEVESIEIVEK